MKSQAPAIKKVGNQGTKLMSLYIIFPTFPDSRSFPVTTTGSPISFCVVFTLVILTAMAIGGLETR